MGRCYALFLRKYLLRFAKTLIAQHPNQSLTQLLWVILSEMDRMEISLHSDKAILLLNSEGSTFKNGKSFGPFNVNFTIDANVDIIVSKLGLSTAQCGIVVSNLDGYIIF